MELSRIDELDGAGYDGAQALWCDIAVLPKRTNQFTCTPLGTFALAQTGQQGAPQSTTRNR
jgi:hypothetical protein